MYKNIYISARVDAYNGTEFKYEVLKDNKHCKYIYIYISIEPKNGTHYEYLSIILLDSALADPNKHYPQIFKKKCLYVKDKEAALLGKHIC